MERSIRAVEPRKDVAPRSERNSLPWTRTSTARSGEMRESFTPIPPPPPPSRLPHHHLPHRSRPSVNRSTSQLDAVFPCCPPTDRNWILGTTSSRRWRIPTAWNRCHHPWRKWKRRSGWTRLPPVDTEIGRTWKRERTGKATTSSIPIRSSTSTSWETLWKAQVGIIGIHVLRKRRVSRRNERERKQKWN